MVMAVATSLKAFALELTARRTATVRTFGSCFCRDTDVSRICVAMAGSKGWVFGDQRTVPAARCPSSACTLAQVYASADGVLRGAGATAPDDAGFALPEHEHAKSSASTSALTPRQARLFLGIADPRPTLRRRLCRPVLGETLDRFRTATRRSAPVPSCTPARSRPAASASCRRGRPRARLRHR